MANLIGRLPQVRTRRPWLIAASVALVCAGAALVGIAGHQAYSKWRSGSDAGRFDVAVPPEELPNRTARSAPVSPSGKTEPDAGGTAARKDDRAGPVDAAGSAAGPVSQDAAVEDEAQPIYAGVMELASVYPANLINPKYWDDPLWAGSTPFGGPGLPDGYEFVSSRDQTVAPGEGSPAVRIIIPALALDSGVAELGVLDLGDHLQYETPDNTVGHIPGTANPGQAERGWYFGHLQSFLQGEGSVFRRLPEIAELIREDPVDVTLVTDDAEYLYRVVATEQLHQDDLYVTGASSSLITLVTCWPPSAYDRRILVHAELIAVKRA